MMRFRRLACASLALSAAPAAAQQLGTIIPDPAAAMTTRDISSADRARQTMNAYGVCVVKSKAIAVRKALALPIKAQVDAALARLALDDCLQEGQLRMPAPLMRGAIYRALYLRDFGRGTPPAADPATSPSPDVTASDPLRTFAACVNVADPADVRSFVMSVPATTAERNALTGLAPALSRCVSGGQQVRFSRATLQAMLAEAAYRQATTSALVNK